MSFCWCDVSLFKKRVYLTRVKVSFVGVMTRVNVLFCGCDLSFYKKRVYLTMVNVPFCWGDVTTGCYVGFNNGKRARRAFVI